MRIAVGVFFLLTACASGGGGGPVVDGSQVGVPFSFAGGGFTREPHLVEGVTSTEELAFVVENVSERPQTVDYVMLRQISESGSPVRIDPASKRVGRMIDPGEQLEVKILINMTPQRAERMIRIGDPGLVVHVDLRHADGTTYRYALTIPMKTTVAIRP